MEEAEGQDNTTANSGNSVICSPSGSEVDHARASERMVTGSDIPLGDVAADQWCDDLRVSSENEGESKELAEKVDDEWARFFVLFRYMSEAYSHIQKSPAYEDEDPIEVASRTMVFDREAGTANQAPAAEYAESFATVARLAKHVQQQLSITDQASPADEQPHFCTSPTPLYIDMATHFWKIDGVFERAARRLCFQMREAVTKQGLVGLVPHAPELGDELVIIRGVCVPMILRPVVGQEGRFVVIAQA
jgi:hypothetical protein